MLEVFLGFRSYTLLIPVVCIVREPSTGSFITSAPSLKTPAGSGGMKLQGSWNPQYDVQGASYPGSIPLGYAKVAVGWPRKLPIAKDAYYFDSRSLVLRFTDKTPYHTLAPWHFTGIAVHYQDLEHHARISETQAAVSF